MSILDLVAVLLTPSALVGWLNRKLALLPHTIGLLAMGVAASSVLLGVDALLPGHRASESIRDMLGRIGFSAVVMDGMPAFWASRARSASTSRSRAGAPSPPCPWRSSAWG